MKAPHLLAVTEGPEKFRPLLDGARDAGLRIGWLDLREENPMVPGLDDAAELGASRAVAVGPETTVAVKRRRGPAILHDLLREHFLGCRLVLVRGGSGNTPRLDEGAGENPEGSWMVSAGEASRKDYSTAELLAALRRPHPWPAPIVPSTPES